MRDAEIQRALSAYQPAHEYVSKALGSYQQSVSSPTASYSAKCRQLDDQWWLVLQQL